MDELVNPSQEIPPHIQLSQMITAKMLFKPIYAAAKLGIADLVKDQPKSAEDLAKSTDTHAPSLYRVLRALASIGIFAERPDGRFETTELARLLESGPRGMRGFAMMFGEPWHDGAWSEFLYCVQTGESGFNHAMGLSAFDFFLRHADVAPV